MSTQCSFRWVLASFGLLATLALCSPAAAQLDAFHAQFWSQGSFGFSAPEDSDNFGRALAAGDFDGDGFADLAIGSPREDVLVGIGSNVVDAGTVIVLYGTADGLSTTDAQLFRQGGSGLAGAAEEGDFWGYALAAGDFNGDDYEDLAVSAPLHDEGNQVDGGEIQIIYGSSAGLTTAGSDSWTHYAPDTFDSWYEFQVGWALAAGDFDGDGFDDLAVGVPGGIDGSFHIAGTGGVLIYRGSASGAVEPVNDANYWDPMSDLALEGGGRFGEALAAGDVDRDGYDDLVVGAPKTRWGLPEKYDAGAVHVIHGSATGLTATGDRLALGTYADDRFGSAVAIGDVDWDFYPAPNPREILAGAPGVDVGDVVDAGAIRVLALDDTNFNWDKSTWFDQNTVGIEDSAEADDNFGMSFAVGRFDTDGIDDVAIGVPLEDYMEANAGLVEVLHGDSSGLSTVGDQYWTQASSGVPDDQESGDQFGRVLAAGDFNADGRSDLAVGIPYEPLGGFSQGGVMVLYAKRPGLIFADDFERGSTLNWN